MTVFGTETERDRAKLPSFSRSAEAMSARHLPLCEARNTFKASGDGNGDNTNRLRPL